jgi:D-arabinose 1-dehydrogenase-like Zn-dependent alcohol dehydrogenase
VKATIEMQPLDAINDVFARMKKGKVNGRIVLEISKQPN